MSGRSEEDELTALELALRELRPRGETIPRDVLMYRAGRASLRSWFWPSTAAMTTTVAVLLGVVLLLRPAPPVVERIVYVTAPANPASGNRFTLSRCLPIRADPIGNYRSACCDWG